MARTLQQRVLATLHHQPQTAEDLAVRMGVTLPVMKSELAHIMWPNGKAKPYGPITCNKKGEYLLGDPTPLTKVS